MNKVETAIGTLELIHPIIEDIPSLVKLFSSEDLDLRRLKLTARDSYSSQGKEAIRQLWEVSLNSLKSTGNIAESLFEDVAKQSLGILASENFPAKGVVISDPFNLKEIEKNGIDSLRKSQLQNILIMKNGGQIISAGRVLPVEGSWELVSLITEKNYRGKGLANIVVNKILNTYTQRPMFSFQVLTLVPYYLNAYINYSPTIPLFEELPIPLQRDLMFMNAFWGPNCIIKINN